MSEIIRRVRQGKVHSYRGREVVVLDRVPVEVTIDVDKLAGIVADSAASGPSDSWSTGDGAITAKLLPKEAR